jgi:hypothetical protein
MKARSHPSRETLQHRRIRACNGHHVSPRIFAHRDAVRIFGTTFRDQEHIVMETVPSGPRHRGGWLQKSFTRQQRAYSSVRSISFGRSRNDDLRGPIVLCDSASRGPSALSLTGCDPGGGNKQRVRHLRAPFRPGRHAGGTEAAASRNVPDDALPVSSRFSRSGAPLSWI